MKKIGLFFSILLLLAACSEKAVQVEVSNPSTTDRMDEIVAVPWAEVSPKLALRLGENFIIVNQTNNQVPYQLIHNGEETPSSLIFFATVGAGKSHIYKIKKGVPDPELFTRNTYGRVVKERKDDFAWENDRIAFRMYGPALAPENPSNGVDIWLKRTNDLIVDKFYMNELEKGQSYHVDNGEGLDCYKVGHTLGAGGIAPFVKDSLWIGNHYATAKVLDSGVLRTSFVLTYDSVLVDGKVFSQQINISLDAGSQLNKAIISYNGDFDKIDLAAGIWLHDGSGNIKTDKENGYIAYAENAVSDAGVESGRNYVGVFIPAGLTDIRHQNDHSLGITEYQKGSQFTYYFGAGWSKWGFDSDNDWFTYMENFSKQIKQPLKATIK